MPETIVKAEMATVTEGEYVCPPDCDPEDLECGHLVERTYRAPSLTYADGSEGQLVLFDLEDFCPDCLEPCLQ